MTKTHDNRSAECSDPSCPCHAWSAKSPSVTYYGHPRLDVGVDYPVSEVKNVLSGDSAPSSPILTVEQALVELREMLGPRPSFQLTVYVGGDEDQWRLSSLKLPCIGGTSIQQCVEQVRKWRKEQQ